MPPPPQPVVSHGRGPHHPHHDHPHHDGPKHHDHQPGKVVVDAPVKEDAVPMLVGLSAVEAASTKAVKRDDDTESTISEHSDDVQPNQAAGTATSWKSNPWSCFVCFDGIDKILDMNNFCGSSLPPTPEIGSSNMNKNVEETPEKDMEKSLLEVELVEEADTETEKKETTPAVADIEAGVTETDDKAPEPLVAGATPVAEEAVEDKVADDENSIQSKNIVLTHVIQLEESQTVKTKAPIETVILEPLNDSDVKEIRESLMKKRDGAPNVSMTMSMDRGEIYTGSKSFRFQNLATGSFCDIFPEPSVVAKTADLVIVEEASVEEEEEEVVQELVQDITPKETPSVDITSADDVPEDTEATTADSDEAQDEASVVSESPEVKATRIVSLLVGVFDPQVLN